MLTDSGVWPPEIDIMENLGDNPTRMYMTYHYMDATHKSSAADVDLANTGYHTYGVDWQAGLIVWYIDGIEVRRFASSFVPKEPMYLLANLAVGGSWPGNPTASTVFPSKMSIDYIRAYERVNNGISDTAPPFGKGVSAAITSPANGATLKPATYITISAKPVNAGVVTMYANDVKICEKNTAPYNCSYLTPKAGGSVQFKAVAIASGGASATALSKVTVTVPVVPIIPTVSIVSPSNVSLKTAFWTTLTGKATNAVKVEYFVNDKLFCTVTKSPYNCSYQTPKTAGTMNLKATATSSTGHSASVSTSFKVAP
jgi:beta-glucanase (GH16 family)